MFTAYRVHIYVNVLTSGYKGTCQCVQTHVEEIDLPGWDIVKKIKGRSVSRRVRAEPLRVGQSLRMQQCPDGHSKTDDSSLDLQFIRVW